jgi:hypothetical protein
VTTPRDVTNVPESLPVKYGRGPDRREFYFVTWPDGMRTTWFPDYDRPTSEVHVWRAPGFAVEVGEIREGDHNTQNVKIPFVPRDEAGVDRDAQ